MSARVVVGAAVVAALGVGVVIGLASPRGFEDESGAAASDSQQSQAAADIAASEAWASAVADAAVAGRLDGMRVALVVTDGTPTDTIDGVTTALADGGAVVVTTAHLGAEWWDPAKSSFRAELATQVSASVLGAEGLGATDVLEHAIVQAMVPGALPVGLDGAGESGGEESVGIDRQEMLLEVLTRAKILTIDEPAVEGVDAVVFVSGAGPEGAGVAVNAAASVWEDYLGSTLIVVAPDPAADATALPATADEAVTAGGAEDEATRPSVVIVTEARHVAAQVVMALVEQSTGGTGVYGAVGDLSLIAVP